MKYKNKCNHHKQTLSLDEKCKKSMITDILAMKNIAVQGNRNTPAQGMVEETISMHTLTQHYQKGCQNTFHRSHLHFRGCFVKFVSSCTTI